MTTVLPAPPAPIAVAGTKQWWALGALVLAVLAVGVGRRFERAICSIVDGCRRDGDRHRHGHGHVRCACGTVRGKSGVGSAVLEAVNKTGDRFGIAVLGSVLSAGYLGRLYLSGLSATAAAAARQGAFGGAAVAHKPHSPGLPRSVDAPFVHGMDMDLLASVAVAVVGAVLTVVFLPRVNAPADEAIKVGSHKVGEVAGLRPATIGAAV